MPPRQRHDFITEMGDDLQEHITQIRDRRRWIEEQWLRANRIWMAHGYENRFVSSETSSAKYNIPFARKALERTIVRGGKLLMPNSKRFEISAVGDISDAKLSNVDKYMSFILSKKIKARTNISQLVRSMILYNRCHLKTSVIVKNGQVWPTQRVVDPFSFYLYPETAVNVDDADFVFEDFMLSYERYKGYVRRGIVKPIDVSNLTSPTWAYHISERLSHQGLSDNSQHSMPTTEQKKGVLTKMPTPFVSLTEVWLEREDSLHQTYIVWNLDDGPEIVGFFKSQYDDPLYRSAVHRSLPNEAYGKSMADDIVELEALCNDQLNKFQEAVDREQGIVFANGKRRDSWKIKGGAVWDMEEPKEDAVFVQMPNTSNNHLKSFQIVLGLINSMGATGTIAEGQPGRNMPRAGAAVQDLISLAMADIQDISELIEQEVLTPSLADIYRVSAEFIPDDQLLRIPGGQAISRKSAILKKEDFTGDYEFEWIGSLQFQNEQLRAQRLMIFVNMLPQLNAMLQPLGYSINVVELLQTVWRYGLGERSLQKIIVPLDELQQTMAVEQVARLVNKQVDEHLKSGSQPDGGNGLVPGLSYSPPSLTEGFVQQ